MSVKPIFRALNAVFPRISSPFSFEIPANSKSVIYGPTKRALLEIIAGKVADPAKRISFPAFGKDLWPSQAIQFVSFGESSSATSQAPFVGARYESFRDEFDLSLRTVLQSKAPQGTRNEDIDRIASQLDLTEYLDNWYVGLSNGQSRRAQLALSLLRRPRMLVMDEPFVGLDPHNRDIFSEILAGLSIPVVIGLRGGDPVPSWVSQVLYTSESGVCEGNEALELVEKQWKVSQKLRERRGKNARTLGSTRPGSNTEKPPTISMKDVTLKFANAETPLFKNLNLTVYDGERVHIRGPNGSGKSTLLALITADHPKSWSSDISLLGERLKVGKHSYFTVNKLIGHSSPEIHSIFPKYLNARRAISTGFTGTMLPPGSISPEQEKCIQEIAAKLEIDLSDPTRRFGDMPLSEQKMILLARALVKSPRILILDEAFSTLSIHQMEIAFNVLDGFNGAVLVVGHVEDEIPYCDKELILG